MDLPPIVEVDRVATRFGGLLVIDELHLTVAREEALGIVGPNGAGKTTLLNLVAGDLQPTRGRVLLDGRDVTSLGSHRRCRLGVGRTSQVPRPFEGLTVFENALVGATFGARAATPRGRRRHEAQGRAVAALERTGLLRLANVRAGELTLLQRKQLELARALAGQPRVLLLDEIAGGLTEAEVLDLVDLVKEIHVAGVAIVWIEHIVHALLRVVGRLVAMDYGRLLVEGDPDEVMASDEVRAIYLGAE